MSDCHLCPTVGASADAPDAPPPTPLHTGYISEVNPVHLFFPSRANFLFKHTQTKTYQTKPTLSPSPIPNPNLIPNPKTHPIPYPYPTPNPKKITRLKTHKRQGLSLRT